MSNKETVAGIYAAFGRGDVPFILDTLAPDVEWEDHGATTDVPWLQPRRGRDGVAGFFAALAGFDIQKFDVHTLLDGGDIVVALVDQEAVVRATGRRVAERDEVHVWRFNAAGLVASFKHRLDTHGQHLAVKG